MKKRLFLTLWISCALLGIVTAQECRDRIFMKDGSVFTGQIKSYDTGGMLVLQSWNGVEFSLPATNVRKIRQKCKGDRVTIAQAPYRFREHGWYHATRASTLVNRNGIGLGLQHSSGIQLSRLLGLGLGLGVEQFSWDYDAHTIIPVFLEARGYLLPKNITPYFAVAAGYGFSSGKADLDFGQGVDWRGGWMAQGQAGYRIGRHFEVFLGIHFQKATRNWINPWWSGERTDHLLYKRLEFGMGLRL